MTGMSKNTVHLFVYGKLQPKYYPPTTMSASHPDAVYGDLYELGNDPLITNMKNSSQLVHGHLITIDRSELPELDKTEKGYERQLVGTESGELAYIYVWKGKVPADAKKIESWPSEGKAHV